MRTRRILQEMLIAIGVAAGVMVVGCLGLLASGPLLRNAGLANNLCTVDRDLVFQKVATGLGANKQIMQIAVRMQAKIDRERRSLNLSPTAPQPAFNPPALTAKVSPQRMAELERRVVAANARLQALRSSATTIVNRRLAPIVEREGRRSSCTEILNRAAVIEAGNNIDLTPRVLAAVPREIAPLPAGYIESLSK